MERKQNVDAVIRALRRVNLQGTVLGQSIAIRLGLSDSDVEALEALVDSGAATAGRLAELMGLTTGAVTRLIDRLEQSGYVRRVPDPADRRRVIVEVVPEKVATIQSVLSSLGRAGSDEIARYTDAQLDLIGDFLTRMADITRAEAGRLRTSGIEPGEPLESVHAAPVGGVTEARLLFRSGASELTLSSSREFADLYRAHFGGTVPKVSVRDGTVSIQYRGGLPFDWRKRTADITLNAGLPWTVDIQGGASTLTGDLRDVDVRSMDLMGGASNLELSLGQPRGLVPIRVVGGIGTLRVDRPHGAAIQLRVVGGIGKAEIDGQHVGGKGGKSLIESRGAGSSANRFTIEVVGGAGRAEVDQRDR